MLMRFGVDLIAHLNEKGDVVPGAKASIQAKDGRTGAKFVALAWVNAWRRACKAASWVRSARTRASCRSTRCCAAVTTCLLPVQLALFRRHFGFCLCQETVRLLRALVGRGRQRHLFKVCCAAANCWVRSCRHAWALASAPWRCSRQAVGFEPLFSHRGQPLCEQVGATEWACTGAGFGRNHHCFDLRARDSIAWMRLDSKPQPLRRRTG